MMVEDPEEAAALPKAHPSAHKLGRANSNFSFHRSESTPPPTLPTASVVKFFVTSAGRSYLQPWVVQRERASTGTGFVIPGKMVMTNAHVVEDATVVEVKKHQDPRKYRAQVLCIGHDVDLALVKVEDSRFWEFPQPLQPISWGAGDGFPDLYSEVRAVGFPTGGSTVCVTKGVISRIDAQLYVHPRLKGVFPTTENSPGNLPIIQIDAAINPGNSGGPAFSSANDVVGVASSGLPSAQNVGYIIPSKIARLFLEEYVQTKAWAGICETGLRVNLLESDAMREYLKMGDRSGVQLRSVAPLGAAAGKVKPGDILLEVDGNVVGNEGTVQLNVAKQDVDMPFDVLITQKKKGVTTKIKFLREGVEHREEVIFGPIPPLIQRFDRYDCSPEYVIIGGLVFTKLSIPLIHEYLSASERRIVFESEMINRGTDAWKQEPGEEVVVLLRGLKHTVNLGYTANVVRELKLFNGEPVRDLAQLEAAAAAVLDGKGGPSVDYLRFCFMNAQPEDSNGIVLRALEVRAADAELCESHRIAKAAQLDPGRQEVRKESRSTPGWWCPGIKGRK